MRGVETEWRETWGRHWDWETSFAGPRGNSANPEVRRSFLRGSWRLCTPFLIVVGIIKTIRNIRCKCDKFSQKWNKWITSKTFFPSSVVYSTDLIGSVGISWIKKFMKRLIFTFVILWVKIIFRKCLNLS